MSRDDIVIRPKLRLQEQSVREKAREGRAMKAAMKRGRIAGRAIRGIALRAATSVPFVGRGIGVAARAAVSPIGLAIAGVAAGIVAATRILADKPFEAMGRDVEKMLLGDLGPQAMAGQQARDYLLSNDDVARSQAGGTTSQFQQLYSDIQKLRMNQIVGRRAVEDAFPVNGTVDALILNMRDKLAAWAASSTWLDRLRIGLRAAMISRTIWNSVTPWRTWFR